MSYRFAIVGCGHIGRRHAELAGRHGHLLAVCDNDSERALELAAKHRAKAYFSIEELLQNERPGIVSICTPNGLHATHAIAALQRDCHVLCEKPMSISSLDCQQMIAAAQKSGKKLFGVEQTRHKARGTIQNQFPSDDYEVYENLLLAFPQQGHHLPVVSEAAKTVEMIEQVYAHSPLST